MENIISVRNLSQRYGHGRQIYENLSFDVPRGSILGLLGKNGTGKTTTINILMGFLKPQSGHCSIFGEEITALRPETRARIALLLEGHVQYSFMTIAGIEKFYSRFYPRWNRDAYYGLMEKLRVSPGQKISSMSNGQRSQVALGLILAQNADLLVLDDFSLGLDPGYRRLFADYLREFVKAEGKTVFMTSHIIQDLERLIDDCIILDYGKILTHKPVKELMSTLHLYTLPCPETPGPVAPGPVAPVLGRSAPDGIYAPWESAGAIEFHSFLPEAEVAARLRQAGIPADGLISSPVASLEDAFIGLTGRY